MTTTITEAGRRYAAANADRSLVAAVAMNAGADWPAAYVETAVKACNAAGWETAEEFSFRHASAHAAEATDGGEVDGLNAHRFCIYVNPQGVRGWTAWMNYAAKYGAPGLVYDDQRWYTDDEAHAAKARRCGMLVAEVTT